jgi:hypothetical protein
MTRTLGYRTLLDMAVEIERGSLGVAIGTDEVVDIAFRGPAIGTDEIQDDTTDAIPPGIVNMAADEGGRP